MITVNELKKFIEENSFFVEKLEDNKIIKVLKIFKTEDGKNVTINAIFHKHETFKDEFDLEIEIKQGKEIKKYIQNDDINSWFEFINNTTAVKAKLLSDKEYEIELMDSTFKKHGTIDNPCIGSEFNFAWEIQIPFVIKSKFGCSQECYILISDNTYLFGYKNKESGKAKLFIDYKSLYSEICNHIFDNDISFVEDKFENDLLYRLIGKNIQLDSNFNRFEKIISKAVKVKRKEIKERYKDFLKIDGYPLAVKGKFDVKSLLDELSNIKSEKVER